MGEEGDIEVVCIKLEIEDNDVSELSNADSDYTSFSTERTSTPELLQCSLLSHEEAVQRRNTREQVRIGRLSEEEGDGSFSLPVISNVHSIMELPPQDSEQLPDSSQVSVRVKEEPLEGKSDAETPPQRKKRIAVRAESRTSKRSVRQNRQSGRPLPRDAAEGREKVVQVKKEPVSEEDESDGSFSSLVSHARSVGESPVLSSRQHPNPPYQNVRVKKEPVEEENRAERTLQMKRKNNIKTETCTSRCCGHCNHSSVGCAHSLHRDVIELPSTSTMCATVARRSSAVSEFNSVDVPSSYFELNAIRQFLSTVQKPDDEDQVFGDYVSSELRALRNPELKRRCKRAIMEALLDIMEQDS